MFPVSRLPRPPRKCVTLAQVVGNCRQRASEVPVYLGRRPMKSIPRLPEHPGLAAYGDLAGSLQLLGCPHMAAFILAGESVPFRVLDGLWVKAGSFSWHRVDSSYLEQVRLRWHEDADPRRRTAADQVIDLVQQALAAEPSTLWRLALFQVGKLLRAADAPDAPPGRLRAEALALRIAEDEVDLLTAAVTAARGGPDPAAVEELIAAQRSNRLRRAARLAEALVPVARDHVLRACLDEVLADNRQVDKLISAGTRLEDAGDVEKAAACYLRAVAVTADDPRIGQALRRCAPPRPRELEVEVTGQCVRLSWPAAEASAGAITYRVRRVAEVPSLVADGPDTCATDRDPPAGPMIAYRVVTVREGSVESAPAVTDPLQVLPDAEDLLLTEQRGCVVGRWQAPPQAAAVRVTRRPDRPEADGDQTEVRCDRTSFRDSEVAAGMRYLYRVTCGYLDADGGMAWSAGSASTVPVTEWPDPVTTLAVTASPDGDSVRLQWMSPAAGEILVILGSSPMPAEGSELTAAEARPLGAVAWSGAAGPAGSPMSCEIPLPGRGVYHLAVVTELGHRAVIGPARVVDSLAGFQHLHARRAGDNIELTWAWSPSSPVTLAAVQWDCAGEEHGIETPQRVTRDSYRRHGFLIPAHSCGYRFTVTPLSTITGSVSVGPPASDELEPQHDLVYVIRKTRRWLRAGRVARIQLAEPPTSPLEFLLVARPGTLRPTRTGQGAVVLRVSATAMDTGSPAEHRIDLSAVRPPYYLLGFLAGPAAPQFRLVHPARTQLLVER
jgi:hypothetical protein